MARCFEFVVWLASTNDQSRSELEACIGKSVLKYATFARFNELELLSIIIKNNLLSKYWNRLRCFWQELNSDVPTDVLNYENQLYSSTSVRIQPRFLRISFYHIDGNTPSYIYVLRNFISTVWIAIYIMLPSLWSLSI